MIDLPNNKFLWISILRLSLNVRKNERSFIHELMRFRDQLTQSNGCDLVINFTAFRLTNDKRINSGTIKEDLSGLPSEKAKRIKLFLYGMSLIQDYQEQIASLTIDIHQPLNQIDAYFLHLLLTMKRARHLVKMRIHTAGPLLRDEWLSTLRSIHHRRLVMSMVPIQETDHETS